MVLPSQTGSKTSICSQYSTVQLNFEVYGTAVSGQAPTMEIEGPCLSSTNSPSRLESFSIPLSSLNQSSVDSEVTLNDTPSKAHSIRISFKNMEANLPHQWVLVSMALKSADGANTFTVKSNEVRKHDPIMVEW
jgi:hypothetical protein